jgi:hypothetical protein
LAGLGAGVAILASRHVGPIEGRSFVANAEYSSLEIVAVECRVRCRSFSIVVTLTINIIRITVILLAFINEPDFINVVL